MATAAHIPMCSCAIVVRVLPVRTTAWPNIHPTPDASIASPLPPILGPDGPLKPKRAELVGHYALQIFWSDGHSTGIYTFEYLRGLCPCPYCSGRS